MDVIGVAALVAGAWLVSATVSAVVIGRSIQIRDRVH